MKMPNSKTSSGLIVQSPIVKWSNYKSSAAAKEFLRHLMMTWREKNLLTWFDELWETEKLRDHVWIHCGEKKSADRIRNYNLCILDNKDFFLIWLIEVSVRNVQIQITMQIKKKLWISTRCLITNFWLFFSWVMKSFLASFSTFDLLHR